MRLAMASGADSFSRLAAFAVAALVAAADQLGKWLAQGALEYGRPVPLSGFLELRLVWNRGAAFSILSDGHSWQLWLLIALPLAICAWLAAMIWRGGSALERHSMALVLGGALGNLADRMLLGHVVDYISLHWRGIYYWPTFNIADAAICAGVALLIVQYLRGDA